MAAPADPRLISVQTPLGADTLYLTSFRGREGLSQLFHFQLELLAENRTNIAFDKLIGQPITISILLPDGKTKRFWNGICNAFSQDGRDSTFTSYRMEVVPKLWLLTRRKQSRIFQYMNVPDILKQVLTGLDIKLEVQGTFHPRDFCVQYRESDFEFASRLMEEEGIYYFFKHTDGGHQMVLANTPQSHPATLFSDKAIFEEIQGGNRPDQRITRWEKTQELRSGKVTLWDHCFELPHQHLDASRPTMETVEIGKVSHKLKLPANDALELYDYPGAYAQRFDGVDRGGGDSPAEVEKIFEDNARTAGIRMSQEAAQAVVIRGSSSCRQFMAGHKFTLERHYNADGPYVLTSVEHSAASGTNFRSGDAGGIDYQNQFTCIPLSLPFRPPQTTEKPFIPGPQTAVVVGPPGEIIFCDKYGRVKVQFHWDRQGTKNADSSCWLRVSQNWGGANWGGMFLPHVGHEVIVSFEEGDPDRPLITGRVYNAECMPPLELPANKTKSAIRDHGGNEIIMEGEPGKQQIRMYCPKHETTFHMGNSFNLSTTSDFIQKNLGNTTWETVGNFATTIGGDVKNQIGKNLTELYMGWEHKTCLGWFTTILVGMKMDVIKGNKTEIVKGSQVKLHKGKLMETKGTERFEKCPKYLKALGTVYYKTKEWKNKIGGAFDMAISKRYKAKAESFNSSTDGKYETDSDGNFIFCKKAKMKADKWEAKAGQAKLKADKYAVNAKMDVKDGTLSIK